MKTILNTLEEEPQNSILRKFIPDIPTYTSLKVYELTTGKVPDFIRFVSNMNAKMTSDDSFLNQMYNHNKTYFK